MVKINTELISKIKNKDKANKEEILNNKKSIKDFLLDQDIREVLKLVKSDNSYSHDIIKMDDYFNFFDDFARKYEVLYSFQEDDSIVVAFQTLRLEYKDKPKDKNSFIEENKYGFVKESSCTINTGRETSYLDDSGVIPFKNEKNYIDNIVKYTKEYDKSIINKEFNTILERMYENI